MRYHLKKASQFGAFLESHRASPAILSILATRNIHFSILVTTFFIQTLKNYLLYSLLSLNIVFQCFFKPTVFFPLSCLSPSQQTIPRQNFSKEPKSQKRRISEFSILVLEFQQRTKDTPKQAHVERAGLDSSIESIGIINHKC